MGIYSEPSACFLPVASPEIKYSSPTEVRSVSDHGAQQVGFDLYEQLLHPNLLRILPCLLGILIGFVACCFAGAVAARTDFYENFHRFNDYTSPSTLFYPTVSQMVAIVKAQSNPEQTVVIVGGNSIFNGIGQRASEIWTDDLREKLGDHFAVFNFATCGSQAFEGAYWVAESLLARGRKVVYVTVSMPTAGGVPEGGKVYGYLFWDAHEKKLLARSSDRDKSIESRLSGMDEKEKTRIAELKLRMQLDKFVHFQDLWTAVGYKNAFTVWTEPTAAAPFRARRLYADMQPSPSPTKTRFSKSPMFSRELSVVRAYCNGFFDIKPSGWHPNNMAWAGLSAQMQNLVPAEFKKNCLVVIARNPPYFLERMSTDERARIATATIMTERCWRTAGFHATIAGADLADEDFQDCWHLVGVGGKKMAKMVAKQVLALTDELGYSVQGGVDK